MENKKSTGTDLKEYLIPFAGLAEKIISDITIDYKNVSMTVELDEKKIRLGGMVKKQSVSINSDEVNFIITDFKNEINVIYLGAVPNLFGEEKGVVAEGFLKDKNYFIATKILAKHDENYMPPEVKEAIGDK